MKNYYLPKLSTTVPSTVHWETFFGKELHHQYDMHFLKADGM